MTAQTLETAQPARTRRVFHAVALAEAVSWGVLLVAMFFKWVVQDDPHAGIQGGVPIAGPVHGVIFIGYVVTSLVAWRAYRWSATTLLVALAAGVPPFLTLVFERTAARRGLLAQRET